MIPVAGAASRSAEDRELVECLEQALAWRTGRFRRIFGLQRQRSAYSSSYPIAYLDLDLEDGARHQLVFKDLSVGALLDRARAAKPAFLLDPLRETEMYRLILDPASVSSPTFYGSTVVREIDRYWLFLERVDGIELYQIGDFAVWQEVAAWLAGFHGRFAGDPKLFRKAPLAHLLQYDATAYGNWRKRARAHFERQEGSTDRAARRQFGWLLERYDRAVERLLAIPPTLLHGEFYPSNILIRHDRSRRVCPVDWEMASIGPAPLDLAALIAGRWTEDEKRQLALAYHEAWSAGHDDPPSAEAFLEELDCCRLQVAIQWLGWSTGWSPPPEHTQDWLTEALAIAERLSL